MEGQTAPSETILANLYTHDERTQRQVSGKCAAALESIDDLFTILVVMSIRCAVFKAYTSVPTSPQETRIVKFIRLLREGSKALILSLLFLFFLEKKG